MGSKRPKMSVADRAKQFMSFDALKGFGVELAKQEKIIIEKSELSTDRAYELNWKIQEIKKGDIITVIYYDSGEYIFRTGLTAYVDYDLKKLRVVNTVIDFDDIYDIII